LKLNHYIKCGIYHKLNYIIILYNNIMCQRVTCPKCGKQTWSGCGKHIEQALAGVPPAQRCTCPKK